MTSVQPDPQYAHSAGTGEGTPNPSDDDVTRDPSDDGVAGEGAEHTSTRTTEAGVEAAGDETPGPEGAARIEHAPDDAAFQALRNPTG